MPLARLRFRQRDTRAFAQARLTRSARPLARTKSDKASSSTATIGFEAKLWLTADKLRNNMDAAEYKHVVLGRFVLKQISGDFDRDGGSLR